MTATPGTITQVDYTSKDYSAFLASLIAAAPNTIPEWTSRSESDFLMLLLELFSYLADIQSYYTDRVANESFLQTAQLRSSVLNIASLIDYTPSPTTAATTNLQFTIATGTGPITIPAGSQVSTQFDSVTSSNPQVVFETQAPLTIYGNAPPLQTDAFTGTGGTAQSFVLTKSYQSSGAVVTVNGVQWSQVQGFAGSNILSAADSGYETGFPGTCVAIAGTALTQSSTQAYVGTHSAQLVAQGAQGTIGYFTGDYALPTPGAVYTAVAAFKAAITPRVCTLQFIWKDANHNVIWVDTGDTGVTNTPLGWTTHAYSSQAPSTAVYVSIQPTIGTNIANNEQQWVDTLWLSQGSAPAGPAALIYTLILAGSTWTLAFGNGTTGAIPPLGATITVKYSPPVTAISYSGTVSAIQGVTISQESVGSSNGGINQDFTLFQSPVVGGTATVFVDQGLGPTPWVFFNNLADAQSTDPAYTTHTDANNITHIVFGDGINGAIPGNAAGITATYRKGGGTEGNVGTNTLTALARAIPGVLTVTNTQPAVGGADAETLDHIRQQAPKSLTAINRAVTLGDYANLAIKVAGVSKAKATAQVYSSVTLYVHPVGGFLPTTGPTTVASAVNALIPFISNPPANTGFLDDKIMVGTTLTILPPQYNGAPGYVPINITVTVQVLPSYSATVVQQAVTDALGKLLSFDNVNFGMRVSLSSVYKAIDAVEGVDYGVVNLLWRADQASGTADVICQPSEMPTLGGVTVVTTGGIPA